MMARDPKKHDDLDDVVKLLNHKGRSVRYIAELLNLTRWKVQNRIERLRANGSIDFDNIGGPSDEQD